MLSQLISKFMKTGSIINITSLAGARISQNVAYVSSKGGLKQLTKAVRRFS